MKVFLSDYIWAYSKDYDKILQYLDEQRAFYTQLNRLQQKN